MLYIRAHIIARYNAEFVSKKVARALEKGRRHRYQLSPRRCGGREGKMREPALNCHNTAEQYAAVNMPWSYQDCRQTRISSPLHASYTYMRSLHSCSHNYKITSSRISYQSSFSDIREVEGGPDIIHSPQESRRRPRYHLLASSGK